MHILMITQLFQPEPNHLKGLAFARELQRRGHSVEVLTGFPNYPGGSLYEGYRMRWLQRETLDGIPVTRVPHFPSHDASGLRRFISYSTFTLSASAFGLPLVARPDVVHVYQGPATLALPALLGRALLGAPFVLDVQDLWPDSVAASGMMGRPHLLSLLEWWCQVSYRLAGRIVVLSPGYKATLVSRGVSEAKIDVIYNWSDETHAPTVPADPGALSSLSPAGTINIVFAGNFGRVQALGSVLKAAALVRADLPQVRIILIGGGVEEGTLRADAEKAGMSNVIFVSRQPPAEIGRYLAAADVLLIHLRDDPLSQIGIPQKTQAYLAAGRPILMAASGDAADLVARAGAGVACEPGNPASIAEAIRTFVAMSAADREAMGRRGRMFYKTALSFAVGVDSMEAALRRAAEAG